MASPAINKFKYGWSRWGGNNMSIRKEHLEVWHCQICGMEQSEQMPQFFFELLPESRDYVRICSICENKKTVNEVTTYEELIIIVRKG